MSGKLNWLHFMRHSCRQSCRVAARRLQRAQSIDEKVEVCAGCHGADGKPIDKTIPVIWGQQAGYLYIQLRDFKRGDRKSDIMQPIAASMERDDMLAIAEYFSKKPWPDLGQPRAPKDVAERASSANALGGLHRLPSRSLSGRRHRASAGRPEPGLSDQDHRRLPHPRARQQSRHVRLDDRHPPDDLAALAEYLAGL